MCGEILPRHPGHYQAPTQGTLVTFVTMRVYFAEDVSHMEQCGDGQPRAIRYNQRENGA
jgi:hypothetical protein